MATRKSKTTSQHGSIRFALEEVGFDDQGRILGVNFVLASHCGYSADLSGSITDRTMLHSDNCYSLQNVAIQSLRCKTNTVSNTAFRGFGGPQGVLGIGR